MGSVLELKAFIVYNRIHYDGHPPVRLEPGQEGGQQRTTSPSSSSYFLLKVYRINLDKSENMLPYLVNSIPSITR